MQEQWSHLAVVAAVPMLRSAACAFAERSGMAGAALGDLRLAVSEAVTNAVVHSYRDDTTPGDVVVTARSSSGLVRVIVADRGMGFRPRLDSPGSGVGLPIIAAVTTSFEIRAVMPCGTEVHMSFRH